MPSQSAITLITIIIYSLASAAGIGGMAARSPGLRKWGLRLSLLAFFCQTLALILGFHKNVYGALSIGAYLQLLAWFILLCGAAAWWRLREEALLLLAAPFGLILFLMSASLLDSLVPLPKSLSSAFYALHIGALFLSLGLLFTAFTAGLIFIFMEKKLKGRQAIKGFWKDMPSLHLLDSVNAACVISAFPLYTLGLLTGLVWAGPVFGRAFSGDPKELASLIIWLLLAFLFHNRLAKGWKGRKPALCAALIFAMSIISILMINFFLNSHHAFLRG